MKDEEDEYSLVLKIENQKLLHLLGSELATDRLVLIGKAIEETITKLQLLELASNKASKGVTEKTLGSILILWLLWLLLRKTALGK